MSVVDIRQSAAISELTQEVAYLKGQNEALFAMLSFLTEKNGGEMTIPKDFNQQIIGSDFLFDRDEEGNYVMATTRESIEGTDAPSE